MDSLPENIGSWNFDCLTLPQFCKLVRDTRMASDATQSKVADHVHSLVGGGYGGAKITSDNKGMLTGDDSEGEQFNLKISQTTICRFESLQLSLKNMLKLKSVLEGWVKIHYRHVPKDFSGILDGTKASATLGMEDRDEFGRDLHRAKTTRKRRTNIDNQQKFILEDYRSNWKLL